MNNRQQRNWTWEHYSYEITALERTSDGAIALITRWAARHVRLTGDQYFDGGVEAVAPPVAGKNATDMAIKAAKILRANAMEGVSGDMDGRVNGIQENLM